MKGAILKPRTESIDFYLKDIRPPKLVLSKQKETELTETQIIFFNSFKLNL